MSKVMFKIVIFLSSFSMNQISASIIVLALLWEEGHFLYARRFLAFVSCVWICCVSRVRASDVK